jgi:hypothetical protein
VFAMMVASIVLTVRHGNTLLLTFEFFSFIPIFGLLVNRHNRIAESRDHYQRLSTINEDEIRRLNGDFNHLDNGSEFVNEDHDYTYDLDVFGKYSLFQLLNHTNTIFGKKLIAEWLGKRGSLEHIKKRQIAVKSLVSKLDWRQNYQAFGVESNPDEEVFGQFLNWLDAPSKLTKIPFLGVILWLMPLFSTVLIFLILNQLIDWQWLSVPIVINGVFILNHLRYAQKINSMTEAGSDILKRHYKMIELIEHETFEGDLLLNLKQELVMGKRSASVKIKALYRIINLFINRGNMLYGALNILFLLDLILIRLAERWKEDYGHEVDGWMRTVSEFEGLNSLAAFSHSNPEFVFPYIIFEKDFVFQATDMGHPLINRSERVSNSFALTGRGKIGMITGSNMAGKSTFLRTLGINTILAYAGSPVCATSFTISPVRIFTSMRTKDNLEEHISGFYSELLRLKRLLQLIEAEETPVLYLLDEILKGTNSADRHEGAEALIGQLTNSKSFGLISTHDLALGELKTDDKIENYSFNSYFEDNKMLFDYKLQKGICKSFNAKNLMAEIGIKI